MCGRLSGCERVRRSDRRFIAGTREPTWSFDGRLQNSLTSSMERTIVVLDRDDIASSGLVIEVQLDATCAKLSHHTFDASFDRRIVRAVTSDKFLDNRPECRWRQ